MGQRRRHTRRAVYSDSVGGGAWNGLVALALLIGGGFVVYILVGKLKEHAEEGSGENTAAANPKRATKNTVGSSEPRRTAPRSGTGGASGGPVAAPPPQESAEMQLNVSVLAKEACRYRNDNAGRVKHESAAQYFRGRFIEETRGQPPLQEHLEPYDEILAIDDVDLRRMSGEDAASHLKGMIEKIPAGVHLKFKVSRMNHEQDFYIRFLTGTKVAAATGEVPDRIKISSDLALEIQKEVLSLPVHLLSDTERTTIERCLSRGEATREEYSLITSRLARGFTATVKKDDTALRAKVSELQKGLATADVPDVVETRDGRRFFGKIVGETPAGMTVETSVGRIPVARADVRFIHSAANLREEFRNKLASAEGNPEAWPAVLTWTRDWKLAAHHQYIAHRMLVMDPEDRVARNAAGYHQSSDGQWMAGLPSPVLRPARNRDEMRTQLEDLGFVFKDGKWFSRAAWSATLDNLHAKTDLKFNLQGTTIMSWRTSDTPMARLIDPSGKLREKEEARERFIAPTGAQGGASILVEAPGEFIECQVKASGTVVDTKRGKVEVYVVPEGGTAGHLLYLIEGGGNAEFHEVSAQVKGKRRFSVQARMLTTVDKYHTYARFLSSLPESKETFVIRAKILQPAPEIDRNWAAMK